MFKMFFWLSQVHSKLMIGREGGGGLSRSLFRGDFSNVWGISDHLISTKSK